MNKFIKKYGQWGIVAGAAEGLGKAFAISLAQRGMNVILIDNAEEKLYATGQYLEKIHGIKIKTLLMDLSKRDNVQFIFEAIEGLDCRLMIYNAAYGPVKLLTDNYLEELDYHIDLNCRTQLHMVYHFIDQFPVERTGGIILMSSLAGIYGTNFVAPYGASKAFAINLAEALHFELKSYSIDIMACCAGATDTPNYRDTLPDYGMIRPSVAKPEKVAERTLRNLGKKIVYIPGIKNQLIFFMLNRLLPRKWSAGLMNITMARMYKKRVRND